MLDINLSRQLTSGLESLHLSVSAEQQEKLLTYLALLFKWNRAYNLTAIRNSNEMLIKHVFDALSVENFLPSLGSWLDVGSGGGVPGLILAIANPNRHWTLLDSNGKKTRFLTQAVIELGLQSQVSVVNARAEDHHGQYDGIIARAVMDTGDFINMTQHLCSINGAWWLMKGIFPVEELKHLPERIEVGFQPITVPLLHAERWLIKATRV